MLPKGDTACICAGTKSLSLFQNMKYILETKTLTVSEIHKQQVACVSLGWKCSDVLGLQNNWQLWSRDFLKTFHLGSSPNQTCFKSSETKGISGWVPVYVFSAICKGLNSIGFCQWVRTVNSVRRQLGGGDCQQVGHGINCKTQALTERVAKTKRCQQPMSSTYQAPRCFSLVLFCLWHNLYKIWKLKNL